MTSLGLKPELRNEDTIRAYLEELVRLKSVVQLSLPQSTEKPFETTLEQVSKATFSSTTTPLLETGQTLQLAFMLDARRFIAQVQVVATGVFSGSPPVIGLGERRNHPRGRLRPHQDRATVFAVERGAGTFLGAGPSRASCWS